MNTVAAETSKPNLVWNQYRDNSCRHLLGIARYLQTRMMNTLQLGCGHNHLRLGFAPYITLIGERGRRLSDIAGVLGISRQACNQAVKPIEKAGYIASRADPTDGRAKTLYLTPRGVKLRRDGTRVVAKLDVEFSHIVGDDAVVDASRSLGRIYRYLGLGLNREQSSSADTAGLSALLPALSDYILRQLMRLTREKGHDGLQLRFGQVLTMIGPSGGRIQQIATIHDVSKQAISAIASELEQLGYLTREADPSDARQIVLRFTSRGHQLIADSVSSVTELEKEFGAIIGQAALRRVNTSLRNLYHGLRLEQDVFEKSDANDIDELARQLRQQLGEQGSQILARLLLNSNKR